ncbi:hypothetical protein MN032_04105 [Agromyces atrinae]|uniref:hypothetical protein n=1 Tax=Agromyces atrinae TaxID=592376 RepID=UPI001F58BDBC|nr:hypothetical protein [Agromyces atrinae]MCI2956867.1 hypothetical protein [Agromyces atrinae]
MTIHQNPPVSHEPPTGAFVAFEYATIRAPRALESLYADTYRGFGWTIEAVESVAATWPTHVTLRLKRDRGIRNRALVAELQRTAEKSLASVTRLERSASLRAVATATAFGILGSGALAGSIFSMDGGLLAVGIVLGTVGLLLWLGGYIGHTVVRNRRAAAVAPLIDREHDALFDAASQASRLLN